MLKGSIVAIVTPFKKGKVDEKAFGDLIEWHIAQGTNARSVYARYPFHEDLRR
ncbi:MAG: 4-hydroxy-tetrahydrodipicolinate synthase [Actinomycetota bacterium]